MLSFCWLILSLLFTLSECQKKGIIYSTTSTATADVKTCSSGCVNINWAYNYGQTPGANLNGLEFVPQLYDTSASKTGTWAANAQAQAQAGSKYVMGFYEPDTNNNAIHPANAAGAWKTQMNPRTSYKKVSPCVSSNTASGAGLSWLREFFNACAGGCTVDYVCVHWYGSVNNVGALDAYARQAVSQFQRPVWVSEFGFTDGNDADRARAVKEAISRLGSNNDVFRYAYFGCVDASETDSSETQSGTKSGDDENEADSAAPKIASSLSLVFGVFSCMVAMTWA
ncbi:hypothetical protein Q7P37_005990 [Cladosporium fusiforme]